MASIPKQHDIDAFTVFAILWSQMRLLRLCALLHMQHLTLWQWVVVKPTATFQRVVRLVSVVAPFATLIFSGEGYDHWLLAATVLSSVIFTLASLPDGVDNGMTFELLIQLNLLGSLLVGTASTWSSTTPAWGDVIAPASSACRWIITGLYVFAGVAKLNRDYFNIRTSSTSVFVLLILDDIGAIFGLKPAHIRKMGDNSVLALLGIAVFLTAGIELAIPALWVLGCVRWGAILDWAFHLNLGIAAYDFSTIVTATLTLWVTSPQKLVEGLGFLTLTPTARGISALLTVYLFLVDLPERNTQILTPLHLVAMVWLGCTSPLFYLTSSSSEAQEHRLAAGIDVTPHERSGGIVFAVGCFTIGILFLNGVAPYVGLKTHATFSMFSNLRVQSGESNHLFIPAWLSTHPWSLVLDYVIVTKTSDAWFRHFHRYTGGMESLKSLGDFAERQAVDAAIHSNGEQGAAGTLTTVFPYALPYWQLRRMIDQRLLAARDEGRRGGSEDFFVEFEHIPRSSGLAKERKGNKKEDSTTEVSCFALKGGKISITHQGGGTPTTTKRTEEERWPRLPWLLAKVLCFRSSPTQVKTGVCSH